MDITSLPDKFQSRITIDPSGCWLWTGNKNDSGYGLTIVEKKQRRIHRVVYEALVGPIPQGLVIDHLCRVRNCCNPEHLEPVTSQINMLRGVSPLAEKASWTHCVNGHEFTPDNTYIHKKRNTRNCRTCMIETARKRRAGKANNGPCIHPDCDRVGVSRGMCTSHYMFFWRAQKAKADL